MLKILLVCTLSLWGLQPAMAQQEAQFTHYMFNTLAWNPAFAGSKGYLSGVAVYRDQWRGKGSNNSYDGRPVTQTFSVHTPVNRRVGVGINLTNDRIGAHINTTAQLLYAYRVPFGRATLSMGLQGGITHWQAAWDQLSFKDARELDGAFDGGNPNAWLPDCGAGLFLYSEKFYAGASIPHLGNFSLRQVDAAEEEAIRKWARLYRHLYFTAGGDIPLQGDAVIFKPSVLIKSTGIFNEFFRRGNLVREIGAPTVFDVDASFLFQKKVWAGIAFRSAFAAFTEPKASVRHSSADSFDLWLSFFLKNGLRLGFSYDYSLGKIASYHYGSFELMLGYDFMRQVVKASHPRYF